MYLLRQNSFHFVITIIFITAKQTYEIQSIYQSLNVFDNLQSKNNEVPVIPLSCQHQAFALPILEGTAKQDVVVDQEAVQSRISHNPKLRVENGILQSIWLNVESVDLRIDFVPASNSLFDPHMIHVIKGSANNSLRVEPYGKKCHYSSVTPGVIAAVSTCNGLLTGTIILKNGIFILDSPFLIEKKTSTTTEIPLVFEENLSFENATEPFENSSKEDMADFKQLMDYFSFNTTDFYDYDSNFTVVNENRTESDVANSTYRHKISKRSSDSTQPATFCGVDTSNLALNDDVVNAVINPAHYNMDNSGLVMELAIFADLALWRTYESKYGSAADSRLSDFMATLMYNVQLLYHHNSITPKINFKIVRYEVLKTQAGLSTSYDAQTYLNYFCAYQRNLGGRTWDHALLFTGYDLTRPYGTGIDRSLSGMAFINGVCDSHNSCLIAEARDFTAAFITAHEIGHSLGMNHDEPVGCDKSFIMSKSLGAGKVVWSSCSVNDLQKFLYRLNINNRNCMRTSGLEKATALHISANYLPGQKYNADQQCAVMYGYGSVEAKLIPYTGPQVCHMLWCRPANTAKIFTSHPALEGTDCGSGRYCINGQCIPYLNHSPKSLTSVNGGWSAWSTVSCNQCRCAVIASSIGVLMSYRTCTNPSPVNGGSDCIGDNVKGVVCNKACPSTSSYYSTEYYIQSVCLRWKTQKNQPDLTGSGEQRTNSPTNACKVLCNVRTTTNRKQLRSIGESLPDGAPCGSRMFCVSGKCVPLNCGKTALISNAQDCQPGWQNCVYADTATALPPQLLWTGWSAWSGCSTTCGQGIKSRARECVSSSAPGAFTGCMGHDSEKSACVVKECPTDSKWSQWSGWSSCSATCGEGTQLRSRVCSIENGCRGPAQEVSVCYRGPGVCSTGQPKVAMSIGKWSAWSAWSACSTTCGSGQNYRTRTCLDGHCNKNESVEYSHCYVRHCEYEWGDWSVCSVTCGQGYQTRYQKCGAWNRVCSKATRECKIADCAEWGGWGLFSGCDYNTRQRKRLRNCYRKDSKDGKGQCPGNEYEVLQC